MAPWRPFTELSTFRREMDRLWNSFLGERRLPRIWERKWAPSLDLSETKDNFVVKAEVPGMDAKGYQYLSDGRYADHQGGEEAGKGRKRRGLPPR